MAPPYPVKQAFCLFLLKIDNYKNKNNNIVIINNPL